jgi:hypothetical protein
MSKNITNTDIKSAILSNIIDQKEIFRISPEIRPNYPRYIEIVYKDGSKSAFYLLKKHNQFMREWKKFCKWFRADASRND